MKTLFLECTIKKYKRDVVANCCKAFVNKMKKKGKNKYKNESFAHWLAMYDVHQDDWTKESIEEQIDLYKAMEGDDEFKSLQNEIKLIVKNNDLHLFLDNVEAKMKLSDLKFMTDVIMSP